MRVSDVDLLSVLSPGQREALSALMTAKNPNVDTFDGAREWLDEMVRRSRSEMFSGFYPLTPALASALLERNPDNRGIKRGKIDEYKSAMMDGRFVPNGESVIVADTGDLNDGQNRCIACVESGQTIKTNIVFGVERKSRMTLGQGQIRSGVDVAKMHRMTLSAQTLACVRLVWLHITFGGGVNPEGNLTKMGFRKPTTPELFALLEADKSIADCAARSKTKKLATQSVSGFCRWFIAAQTGMEGTPEQKKEKIEEFFDSMNDEYGHQKNEVLTKLRLRLTAIKGVRHSQPDMIALILHAWNYWIENPKRTIRGLPEGKDLKIPDVIR